MSEYIFNLPDLGEGLVEAEIAEWMVKVGDHVNEEDPIGAMLTDKAAVELSAPVSGRVVRLAGEVGDTLAVGSPMIVFEIQDDQKSVSAEAAAPAPEPVKTSASDSAPVTTEKPKPDAKTSKVLTSPSVRRQAREADIDLSTVRGSGPRGRILRADLEQHLSAGAGAGDQPGAPKEPSSEVTEIKVIGLRRKIAERMTEANRDIPHFAYVEEVDITSLESQINSRSIATL